MDENKTSTELKNEAFLSILTGVLLSAGGMVTIPMALMAVGVSSLSGGQVFGAGVFLFCTRTIGIFLIRASIIMIKKYSSIKLASDWKYITKKAWSMRFMALAAISNGALMIVAMAPELIKASWGAAIGLAALSAVFNLLAMWSRVVAQKDIK